MKTWATCGLLLLHLDPAAAAETIDSPAVDRDSCGLSQDGSRAIIRSLDQGHIFDTSTGERTAVLTLPPGRVFTAGRPGAVVFWTRQGREVLTNTVDLMTGTVAPSTPEDLPPRHGKASFECAGAIPGPDGSWYVASCGEYWFQPWRIGPSGKAKRFGGGSITTDSPQLMALSADGSTLAVQGRIYDTDTLKPRLVFTKKGPGYDWEDSAAPWWLTTGYGIWRGELVDLSDGRTFEAADRPELANLRPAGDWPCATTGSTLLMAENTLFGPLLISAAHMETRARVQLTAPPEPEPEPQAAAAAPTAESFEQAFNRWREVLGVDEEERRAQQAAQPRMTPCDGDCWSGFGTRTFLPSGHTVASTWKNGDAHGQGTVTLSNGDVYVGELKYGALWGQGTYTSTAGWTIEGEFAQGSPVEGTFQGTDKDWVFHGPFRDWRPHGQAGWTRLTPSPAWTSEPFVDHTPERMRFPVLVVDNGIVGWAWSDEVKDSALLFRNP